MTTPLPTPVLKFEDDIVRGRFDNLSDKEFEGKVTMLKTKTVRYQRVRKSFPMVPTASWAT